MSLQLLSRKKYIKDRDRFSDIGAVFSQTDSYLISVYSTPGAAVQTVKDQEALAARVTELEQSLMPLKQIMRDQALANAEPRASSESSILPQVHELHVQMKQFQLHVVGKGVQIANKVFQSFDEVLTWVTTQLPNHRYGLFVDGISIFEFFTHGHIDA